MKVSVILPVRDGAEMIGEAIASVLTQSGAVAIELIVVDDGSVDTSAAIARVACPEAVILATSGVGPAAARNAGLAVATGDVIGFIDHDDLWPAGKLVRQLAVLADPAVDVVGGETLVEWHRDPTIAIRHVHPPGYRKILYNIGSYLVRRRVFDGLGGFDASLRFAEDVDLLFRIEEAGLTVRYLPDLVLLYRVHGRNMTCGRRAHDLGILDVIRRRLLRRDGAALHRPRTSGLHAE